jgi:hypothetical protein
MLIIHIQRCNCDIFTSEVTSVQNVHHQQQYIVENDVQQIGRRSVFQFHT